MVKASADDKFEEGMKIVLDNLDKHIAAVEGKTIGGLLAAGFIVQRDAMEHVPVEYGNLRASAYTRRAQNNALAVEVGFSAKYAVYVHENMEMKLAGQSRPSGLGNYWGPDGEPRYLINAVDRNTGLIVQTIAEHAKIKPGGSAK